MHQVEGFIKSHASRKMNRASKTVTIRDTLKAVAFSSASRAVII